MAGSWIQLKVKVRTSQLDDTVAIMSVIDSGLMIEDFSDFSLNGMYGELVDEQILNADTSHARVSLFLSEDKNVAECRAFIEERLCAVNIDYELALDNLSEEDWAHSWKKYYHPVHIGRVTVVPMWEEYTPNDNEVIIKMDPGMAFGTGTHETTRLVMRIMQDELCGGERALDIGTGSGILAILASKLGARSVNAYDIDPVAVKVARQNVADGGCDNVSVDVSDLLSGVDLKGGRYDFCVANIVSDIIIRMIPDLAAYLNPGAPVILSGIIEPREREVVEALRAYGYEVLRRESENDWVGLLVRAAK